MPVCPACHAQYDDGHTECPNCQAPLVEETSAEEMEASEDQAFVTVFEGQDPMDYRMAKGLLESNGFHLKLIGGHDASYPPLAAQIQVPEAEAEAAQALLDSPGAAADE